MNHQETFSLIVFITVVAAAVSGGLVIAEHSAAMYTAQWTGVLAVVAIAYRAVIAAFRLR